ncbi:hypothetical protein [uncultured Hoeflea sp.]|uniref:hypothetical protein n=1 Tax=uncultured Hoeflea sp. TaxID=538666 RepID=UPI002602D44B|nr:hypothetical protein [uncultured Hoeflea sp.]
MPEFNPTLPFIMTIIILLVILAVFAMKYGAQFVRDRSHAARGTDTDLRLKTLDEQSSNLEKRVTHIEALLKEVE